MTIERGDAGPVFAELLGGYWLQNAGEEGECRWCGALLAVEAAGGHVPQSLDEAVYWDAAWGRLRAVMAPVAVLTVAVAVLAAGMLV